MKNISAHELTKIVEPSSFDVETGIACNRLGYFYCRQMRRRNLCTEACSNCREHIEAIIKRIGTKDDVIKDNVAVLVWSIRSEIADIDEKKETQAEPATDWLGQPVETNIFEMYTRTLV